MHRVQQVPRQVVGVGAERGAGGAAARGQRRGFERRALLRRRPFPPLRRGGGRPPGAAARRSARPRGDREPAGDRRRLQRRLCARPPGPRTTAASATGCAASSCSTRSTPRWTSSPPGSSTARAAFFFSAYSRSARDENLVLQRMLAERRIDFATALPARLGPGQRRPSYATAEEVAARRVRHQGLGGRSAARGAGEDPRLPPHARRPRPASAKQRSRRSAPFRSPLGPNLSKRTGPCSTWYRPKLQSRPSCLGRTGTMGAVPSNARRS